LKNIDLKKDTLLIMVTGSEGQIIHVSDEVVEHSGYAREELIGESKSIFEHEDIPQEIFSDIERTTSQGEAWRGYLKYKTKDSSYYWVDAIVTKIAIADAKPSYLSIGSKPSYDEVESYINKKHKQDTFK